MFSLGFTIAANQKEILRSKSGRIYSSSIEASDAAYIVKPFLSVRTSITTAPTVQHHRKITLRNVLRPLYAVNVVHEALGGLTRRLAVGDSDAYEKSCRYSPSFTTCISRYGSNLIGRTKRRGEMHQTNQKLSRFCNISQSNLRHKASPVQ